MTPIIPNFIILKTMFKLCSELNTTRVKKELVKGAIETMFVERRKNLPKILNLHYKNMHKNFDTYLDFMKYYGIIKESNNYISIEEKGFDWLRKIDKIIYDLAFKNCVDELVREMDYAIKKTLDS